MNIQGEVGSRRRNSEVRKEKETVCELGEVSDM